MPDGYYHTFALLRSANANGILSKEGHLPSILDPVCESDTFGIHTYSGNL